MTYFNNLGQGRVGFKSPSGGGNTPLLLDAYSGASAAYSLRKLSSTYVGSAIRVRRSSDNTSQDIGFNTNGDLDTTSLLSFVGVGNGFVSIWYDQSGTNRNATQLAESNQPQIVSNGTVLTLNSKPRINFNAKSLNFTGFGSENFSIFALIKRQSTASYSGYIQNVGGSFNGFKIVSREDYIWRSTIIKYNGTSENLANSRHSLAGSTSNTRYLENWVYPNNPSALYENNVNKAVGTTVLSGWGNNQTTSFGSLSYAGGLGGEFDFQEFIIYSSNQTSNLNGINTNLNSYYTIY
jgi:hypothetical protein